MAVDVYCPMHLGNIRCIRPINHKDGHVFTSSWDTSGPPLMEFPRNKEPDDA